MIKKISRNVTRQKRHQRIRNKISGTAACPRLCVHRSNSHMHAQLIDDVAGNTLVSSSTVNFKNVANGNIAGATLVGKDIAEKALAAGITTIVFDRSGYIYTGRVKALAEAARTAGLKF